MPRNQGSVLASRPTGVAGPENFRFFEKDTPAIAEGQVLVRHHYLSLDPYMRGRMDESKSYAASQQIDDVMIGGTVGEVVNRATRNSRSATRSSAWAAGRPIRCRTALASTR